MRYDIVIAGAGPAGIAAACVARETGKQVLVIDNMPAPGGNIWRGGALLKKGASRKWAERFHKSTPDVWTDSTMFASPKPGLVEVETPQGVKNVEFGKLILAVGARELFVPFPGWTLPNVFGCGGLQALAKGGWPVAGKRIVVAGSGPLLLAAAAQLKEEGATVCMVAEQAPMGSLFKFGLRLPLMAPSKVFQAIGLKFSLLGVPFKTGRWVSAARGNGRVEGVTLSNGKKTWDIECDYLACSYSLIPSLEVPLMLGCALDSGRVKVNDLMETSVPNVYCAGEPNGVGGVDTSLVEGQIAGYAAAGATQWAQSLVGAARRGKRFREALARTFELRPEIKTLAKPETIVCRCEDITRSRLEGYATWRAAKLQTRCGMGACQGRVCGGAVQVLFGWEGASVRPPVLPVRVDALAGEAQ